VRVFCNSDCRADRDVINKRLEIDNNMTSTKPQKPERGLIIGTWKLTSRLNGGGNGEVWKAARLGRPGADAIKFLRPGPDGFYKPEPLRRFQNEVAALRTLGSRPGVLPLLDAGVPPDETTAWFAMPIAVPLNGHFGMAPPLQTVVEAVASLAETLAAIEAEFGFHHRDLKPENLFLFAGQWVLGDFGLVRGRGPSRQSITRASRPLGPRYFMAPEMLRDPKNAAGGPADVFSLAKTLWVLASGERIPPHLGPQRLEDETILLSRITGHPRALTLDRLIERATSLPVERRPQMKEIAAELRSWLASPQPMPDPEDVSDLRSEFESLLEPARRRATESTDTALSFRALVQRAAPQLEELSKRITDATGIPGSCDAHPGIIDLADAPRPRPFGPIAARGGFYRVMGSDNRNTVVLHFGIGAALDDAGNVFVLAGYGFASTLVSWSTPQTERLGTAAVDFAMDNAISWLASYLRPALVEFSERILRSQHRNMP
jgi:serine/threonine protein kinase